MKTSVLLLFVIFCTSYSVLTAQITINEGSNKNYTSAQDEDGEFPDWIELYNSGSDTIFLLDYALTDDISDPTKWQFPNIALLPGEFKTVFCSGKNRTPVSGFTNVLNDTGFLPTVGWNQHVFNTPFYWDGISSILINTCSYTSTGYTLNAVFNQSATSYPSTTLAFQDGSPYICEAQFGGTANQRPNLMLNNVVIGTGTIQNGATDYPAPYGNWYWAAKHQLIIPGAELIAAGLTEGFINSLSFDVVSAPSTTYDFVDISMKLVSGNEVTSNFEAINTSPIQHTNFKISSDGETVYLFSPAEQLISSLLVNCSEIDQSVGSAPDASANIAIFNQPTPSATNNTSTPYYSYLLEPTFSLPSGLYDTQLAIEITNPNGANTEIRYTLDGNNPTETSPLYSGPINIYYSNVLKARVFSASELPSPMAVSSYLIGIDHVTPILSVTTNDENLYGPTGIFDNWQFDWERSAYVEYFDTSEQLIFSQLAGMQVDGGAGGSRSNPQHSFRVELADPVLGEGSIDHMVIPNRPYRTKFSKFYLRNGSNYFLSLPHKDATLVEAMCAETNTKYSAWRPVTVYINGEYFGLYELREKIDTEYFEELENADADSIDLLSLSFWNGSVLRAVEGSVDSFYTDYQAFNALNTANSNYWDLADAYFDMTAYNDYIISETWAGNVDWPQNNIKIYRSNTTNFRWRYCTIDLEGSMNPFGFSNASDDHVGYILNNDPNNPHINIFMKSIQNQRFRRYFINRFADLMNTSYKLDRVTAVANDMLNNTVVEMPNEYQRWGNPWDISGQMDGFLENHQTLLDEMAIRTDVVRDDILNNFNLTSLVDVELDVLPVGAGKIKISTIIPAELPWTGVYFNGNPVRLTAIANPGYVFSHWAPNTELPFNNPNISIELNIDNSTTFTAVFETTSSFGQLAISEVNFHSDNSRDAGDWIELHNYGNASIDLSGYRFTDSTIFNNYIFTSGTTLPAGGYLVLVEDLDKFESEFPSVNALPINFGFSNSNEPLTIFDATNTPILTMHYQDSLPWQIAADGFGRTLELVSDASDPALPSSWFAGCLGGSPGGPYVPCNDAIVYDEINYKSLTTANTGDWVELYNTTSQPINLTGWYMQDSDDSNFFAFPAGTILPALGRLVVFNDQVAFNQYFPNVANKVGPFDFSLNGQGEAIRLFNLNDRLIQSVVYDEDAPWPQGADGDGYTLQLIDSSGILCDGANWQDGCYLGSPGTPFVLPCLDNSVDELILNEDLIVLYPNPSDGNFAIELDAQLANNEVVVEVYNYLGAQIHYENFENTSDKMEIKLPNVSSGMYLMKVAVDGQLFHRNILVK